MHFLETESGFPVYILASFWFVCLFSSALWTKPASTAWCTRLCGSSALLPSQQGPHSQETAGSFRLPWLCSCWSPQAHTSPHCLWDSPAGERESRPSSRPHSLHKCAHLIVRHRAFYFLMTLSPVVLCSSFVSVCPFSKC